MVIIMTEVVGMVVVIMIAVVENRQMMLERVMILIRGSMSGGDKNGGVVIKTKLIMVMVVVIIKVVVLSFSLPILLCSYQSLKSVNKTVSQSSFLFISNITSLSVSLTHTLTREEFEISTGAEVMPFINKVAGVRVPVITRACFSHT